MSLPSTGLKGVQINALTDSRVGTFCAADEPFCELFAFVYSGKNTYQSKVRTVK